MKFKEIFTEGTITQEKFLSKNFPGHSVADIGDDYIFLEIGQEIDREEFNNMFKNVKFKDPEFDEIEVITPKNKRFMKKHIKA